MSNKPHLLGLLAGLFLAAGLVLSAVVFTRAWLKIAESQTISVSGSARKNIKSDLAIWRASFLSESDTLAEAQSALKESRSKIENFLREKGITNYTFTSVSIQEIRVMQKTESETTHNKVVGYRLSQIAQIRSPDVDGITQLDRDSTTLVEQGVLLTPYPLEYIYTKAGEAKIEMLAEATKDARARAEQIASQGGRSIAQLRNARMGVFQITPMYSTQVAWDGMNDTTSLEKTVTSVVTATFSLK